MFLRTIFWWKFIHIVCTLHGRAPYSLSYCTIFYGTASEIFYIYIIVMWCQFHFSNASWFFFVCWHFRTGVTVEYNSSIAIQYLWSSSRSEKLKDSSNVRYIKITDANAKYIPTEPTILNIMIYIYKLQVIQVQWQLK